MVFVFHASVFCCLAVIITITEVCGVRHLQTKLAKSSGRTYASSSTKCNGLEQLCRLRINQITFPGSHNAGSGFDGLLYYWGGGPASSCFYRNHGKSFSEQLEFGIRYFDIDTCYRSNEAVNCHCDNGKYCAYTGSIEKGLSQIDNWMNSHPNEIVVIHFNEDVQKNYEEKIAKSLEKTLLKMWRPNRSGNLSVSGHYKTYYSWPKLKDAIYLNERIFIFMDDILFQHISQNYRWVVNSSYFFKSTWDINPMTSSCSTITVNAKKKCDTNRNFIELSAVGSYGLCTWDMATICSKWLGEAEHECYKLREKKDKTVNFLLVDYADYHSGQESVINKAKFMNKKNIKKHLDESVFFPELAGCSYHAWWAGHYCWKYCPEYGWCWINKECGSDADVCKQADYQCYTSC